MIALRAGGAACGHLEPVKPAPGYAHHAHLPAAPPLRGDPLDGVESVVLLLLQVFVENDAFGIAAAAYVDAKAGIAARGKPRVGQLIPVPRAVPAAIGDVFDDRRHGPLVGVPPATRDARPGGCRRTAESRQSRYPEHHASRFQQSLFPPAQAELFRCILRYVRGLTFGLRAASSASPGQFREPT
jgi:hypothetical protein